MVQWVNLLQNNIFINPPPLPLLCEVSGAQYLAQPGFTAGRQITGEFQKFQSWLQVKIFDLSLHLTKVQHH